MKVAVRRVLPVVRRGCLPLLCLSVLHLAGAGPTQAQISAGDVVVTDRLADGIIRIDLDGTQTLLGTGGSINSPRGLAVDGDGFLYLTSTSGTVWRAFSDAGGGSQDLIRFGSPLKLPRGLVVAPLPNGLATNGTLYVAEKPAGFPTGLVWQVDTATGAISSSSEGGFLNLPTGIAREPGGTLLVASGSTVNFNGLFRVDPATFDPSNPSANQEIVSERGMLVFPQRPAIDADDPRAVFLTDFGGTPLGSSETFPPQVLCIDASVPFDPFDPKANQTQLSSGGFLERPVGIVIEDLGSDGVTDSGRLLVASADAEAIVRITFTPDADDAPCPAGSGVQTILTQGGLLDLPWDLQVMPPEDPFEAQPFYISDTSDSGGAVYFVEPALDSRTEIVPGSFSNPTGLALDLDGHLIVLDAGDGSVYRVSDPDPRSGTPVLDFPALATGLSGPTGVVVDSEGHILVVDRDAEPEEILRIRPDGMKILIARHDTTEPTDPLVDPVGATLGVDGQLIVADAGDASTGDVPRLVQVDPSTGFRQAIAFPVPSLPPLAGVVGDLDGSNLVTGDGSQSETLVRQSLPIGSPTYRSESDDSVFVRPRGLDLDGNRSVLVVDSIDDDTSTQTGVVRRVDTLSPPDTAPSDVPTGATGFFFDPYDIAVALPPDPPVLDLDADGVPDGSDNCSSTQNPPSVCSGDKRTACRPNDDECFSSGAGSCAVNVCTENQSLACADDADCVLNFGSCLVDAVCSGGEQDTPCTNSADCDEDGLGSCIQNLCSLDTTVVCAEDADCTPDLGTCLIAGVCTGNGMSCDASMGSCEQAGKGSCIQLDEDEDEVGNACDNCQLQENTPAENPQFGQDDVDGDGLGDACDGCDVDGSGVTDSVDLDLLNSVYFDHDGACSLDDLLACDDDTDCPDQTCMDNLCSLDGLACIDETSCVPNTCGPSPADCNADGVVDPEDRMIVVDADGVIVGPGFDFDEDFIADQTDVCPDDFDPSVCSLAGTLCDIPAPGDPNPCPGTETCTQPDADLDGVGDACNDLDDTDLDEIADAFDNCIIDVNKKMCSGTEDLCIFDTDCAGGQTCEQPDEDGDGFGDDCDTCPGLPAFSRCTLDLVQCPEDSDCATQTCDANLCSLDGFSCSDASDCATQTCELFDGDRDGDLVQDTCDVCPDDFDPRVCSSSGFGCRFDRDCEEDGETCIDQPDQNGDGEGDACDDDVDGDGIDDVDGDGNALDNCPTDANMDQLDGDGDLIGDVCDSCPQGGPDDIDGDGDLIQDVCDNCPVDLNPRLCTDTNLACIINADCQAGICELQVDTDGDTAGDRCDSCPSDSDPPVCSTDGTACSADTDCSGGQTCGPPDEDGDGVGDACDACPGSPEPMLCTDDFTRTCNGDNDCIAGLCVFAPDIDGDGIQNTCDLCPEDFDPWVCGGGGNIECRFDSDCSGQSCLPRDLDSDGTPDACDANIDDDVFDNDQDNCNDVFNDSQEDANSDGIGDACDPDFTNDGRVTAPDFTALSLAFGQASFPDGLDTTGDGNVAAPEFTLLSIRFGSETIDWGLPGCDGRAPPSSPLPAGCNP